MLSGRLLRDQVVAFGWSATTSKPISAKSTALDFQNTFFFLGKLTLRTRGASIEVHVAALLPKAISRTTRAHHGSRIRLKRTLSSSTFGATKRLERSSSTASEVSTPS